MQSIKDHPVYQWVKKLSNVKLEQDKNLKEILNYEGVSLWWFIENIMTNKLYYPGIRTGYDKKYFFLRYCILFVKPVIQYIFGKFIDLFLSKHEKINRKNASKQKVLFIGYSADWRVNSNPAIKIPKKDIQLGEIIENLKKRDINLVALQHDSSKVINIRTLSEKIKYQPGLWKPMETYLNFSIIIKTLKSIRHFDRIHNKLRKNDKFRDLLKYENSEETSKMLLDEFALCFQYYIPKSLMYLEIMKNVIETEKPDVIVITEEYGIVGIDAIIAGKMMKVPVLAILHGIMGPMHYGYVYMENEVSMDIREINKRPLPDKTAVFGPYDKKILTEVSAYPVDSVVVTGAPRYDILARANEVYNKEKLFEKLNLDKNKKLIVWATNSGVFNESSEKDIYAVFDSVKKLSESVQLVIKKHPIFHIDDLVYKRIGQEKFNITPIIITREIETLELLYASDLVIIEESTVGLEAMILGKPVIRINFSKLQEGTTYVTSGAALGVYNEEDLIINIKNVLSNKETQEKLKKAREKFVYEHAYLQDGKATERVCDLIEDMIKNEKHIQK